MFKKQIFPEAFMKNYIFKLISYPKFNSHEFADNELKEINKYSIYSMLICCMNFCILHMADKIDSKKLGYIFIQSIILNLEDYNLEKETIEYFLDEYNKFSDDFFHYIESKTDEDLIENYDYYCYMYSSNIIFKVLSSTISNDSQKFSYIAIYIKRIIKETVKIGFNLMKKYNINFN